MRVLDRGREQCAIVTIDVRGWDAQALVAELARRRINTTASLRWYGLLDFTEKGTTSALRISPHYYNTEDEVDAVISSLREIIARRGAGDAD